MSRLLLGVSLWTWVRRIQPIVVRRSQPIGAAITPGDSPLRENKKKNPWLSTTKNYTTTTHTTPGLLSCRRTFATAKKTVKKKPAAAVLPLLSSSRHENILHAGGDAKKSRYNKYKDRRASASASSSLSSSSSSSSRHGRSNEDDDARPPVSANSSSKKRASSALSSLSSSRSSRNNTTGRTYTNDRHEDMLDAIFDMSAALKNSSSSRTSSPQSRPNNRYDDDDKLSTLFNRAPSLSPSHRHGRYKDDDDDAKKPATYNNKKKKWVSPLLSSPSRHNNRYQDDAKKQSTNFKKRTGAPLSNPSSTKTTSIRYQDDDDAKPSTCNNNNNNNNNNSDDNKIKKKKKKAAPPLRASDGRIVTIQQKLKSTGSANSPPKLCVGCGTEVVAGGLYGASASADQVMQGMVAGQETGSKKKRRYVDAYSDPSLQFTSGGKNVTGFLCERCKALQGNDIWKAYDSLRDVSPKVFADQLQHIVRRRAFSLCLMVVDATDAEHTAIKNLRKIIGKTPVMLAINKIDLLPRFNAHDCKMLTDKIQAITGLALKQKTTYGVSAITDAGIVELARDMLRQLGGRDVFVVGCANVGKSSLVKKLSSLISRSVFYKGGNRHQQEKRRVVAQNLNVTGSNLPGTTLQAVRVPCFSSLGNALWDTPGIINPRAVQYHLFPSHLMEPMLHPRTIEVPTVENGLACRIRAGFSILIEATWMDDSSDDAEDGDDNEGLKHITSRGGADDGNAYGVLGRIDVKTIDDIGSQLQAEAFIHPALRIRIVPTELAPSRATVAPHHIEAVRRRIRNATRRQDTGLADAYSLPLSAYISKERPDGAFKADVAEQCPDGYYRMDIVFASLGFVKFTHKAQYEVIPHCVEGSIFSKRSRGLYPSNLSRFLRDQKEAPELEPIPITDEVLRELRDVAREGRHFANVERVERDEGVDEIYAEIDDWNDPDFFRKW